MGGAGQMPEVRRGRKGVVFTKTKGGNTVGASVDEEGRTFLFDRAGNLYYDTGDRRLGFYIVRPAAPLSPSVFNQGHCSDACSCSFLPRTPAFDVCRCRCPCHSHVAAPIAGLKDLI